MSTYTSELRIEKIGTGELTGTWGTKTNTQYDILESAISGTVNVAFASDGNDTLTTANGADDEARHMVINLTGGSTLSTTRNMVIPTSAKLYIIRNGTTGSQSVQIIGASGSGITIPNGKTMFLRHDGTNVVDASDYFTAITTPSATITGGVITGITDLVVADGGTGASTFTDGGVLLGSGTGAISAMAVLANSEMIVGDGTTDPVAESGATLRTSVGVGTGDSPQFTGIELGHVSDTTLTRPSSGDVNIEGNIIYRAGGTDVPVADGGTGASTFTDGGVLLGSGTGAVTAMAVLANGEMIVGDGTTDPVAESGTTLRTSVGVGTGDSPQFTGIELGHATDTTITRQSSGDLNIEGNIIYRAGGTDVPVADGGTGASTFTDGGVLLGSGTGAVTAMAVLSDGQMIVGDGTTDPVAESGTTLRTSVGVGTGDSPQFTGVELGHATDTTITRSAAGVIAVEGVLISPVGQHTIFVPAAAMEPAASTAPAANNVVEIGTSLFAARTLDFAAGADNYAYFGIQMPKSWDVSEALILQYVWSATSSNTETVMWGAAALSLRDDSSLTEGFAAATPLGAVDVNTAAANDIYITPEVSITVTNTPAKEDYVMFEISRIVGSDSLAVAARLHGIKIHYTTDAGNDT